MPMKKYYHVILYIDIWDHHGNTMCFVVVVFYMCSSMTIIRVIRQALAGARSTETSTHTHVQGEGGVFNGTSTEAEGNICGH